jgi:hypothetical protein
MNWHCKMARTHNSVLLQENKMLNYVQLDRLIATNEIILMTATDVPSMPINKNVRP